MNPCTPGPWHACSPDDDNTRWEIEDGYGHTATVYGEGAEGQANARLIAAAPELLEALQNMLSCADAGDMDSLANASDEARDVIQKATQP